MIWLTRDMVEAFHRESLARFGGADGLRDEGLLLSALARPENFYTYEQPDADLYRLAAAYAYDLARCRPFVSGNERTAMLAAAVFLRLNELKFEYAEVGIVNMVLGLADHEFDEEDFAEWLRVTARDMA